MSGSLTAMSLIRGLPKRHFSTTCLLLEDASSRKKVSSAVNWRPKKTKAITESVQQIAAANKQLPSESNIHHSFMRKFGMGSTYDPFDFSLTKLKLDREAQFTKPKTDQFLKAKFDPLKLWKEPIELSEYISTNGSILPGYRNGHRKKTQKRLAKAIRRSRAAGLLSPLHQDVSKLPTERYRL